MKNKVDTLIVVSNDRLLQVSTRHVLDIRDAFHLGGWGMIIILRVLQYTALVSLYHPSHSQYHTITITTLTSTFYFL